MKNKFKHTFRLSFLAVFLVLTGCACTSTSCEVQAAENTASKTETKAVPEIGHLQDFGEPNVKHLARQLRRLKNGKLPENGRINIIQFGDSHTASDTFTGPLREQLQQEYGNAGIGWITPMNVRGQGHKLVSFESKGWTLTSSRAETSLIFPMGGYIATADRAGARITIDLREESTDEYKVSFWLRGSPAPLGLTDGTGRKVKLHISRSDKDWALAHAKVKLPFTIEALTRNAPLLGGIWLEKTNNKGVLVSPIGANGLRQSVWFKWQKNWTDQLRHTSPDVVIIAYGTNEAFNPDLDIKDMKNMLHDGIKQVRQAAPKAVIVLLGAPDTVDKKRPATAVCNSTQPEKYKEMRQAQKEVAQVEKLLYWDWQQAMGGDCQMLPWNANGLVSNDLIHFTGKGYEVSAKMFYKDFINYLEDLR
ncbi:GDSL-type esterase/lipase family protein [Pseudomonas sp. F1_0610]|uniref:GDSL-type esterase/lipase family protein n=1 Tax=Pseudomonas sp. F1_0610 TaxID=3114284 RepID=UPI0039C2549F